LPSAALRSNYCLTARNIVRTAARLITGDGLMNHTGLTFLCLWLLLLLTCLIRILRVENSSGSATINACGWDTPLATSSSKDISHGQVTSLRKSSGPNKIKSATKKVISIRVSHLQPYSCPSLSHIQTSLNVVVPFVQQAGSVP